MASFAEELRKGTEELQRFNGALRAASMNGGLSGGLAAGGGGGGLGGVVGGLAAGRGFLAAAGPAGLALAAGGAAIDAVNAGARFLTPAANAYAVTGTSQGFASAVNQSVLGAVQDTSIGGLILAATGVTAANETNQRAGAAVGNVTEDLARIGVAIPDETRRRLFAIAKEQENRVTEERGRIAELAGSADALAGAKPAGAGAGFDEIVSILRSIEQAVRGVTGGKSY